MTSTERKLDEAKYFYRRLNIDDPYFDYNLSAFLNAARSITWVMRHEFHKVEGWNKWFQEYNVTTQGKQLLTEINDLRIEATKKAGLKTNLFFLQTDFLVYEKFYPELERFRNLEDGEYLLSLEPITDKPVEHDEDTITIVGEISRSDKPYDGEREKLKEKCEAYLKLMDEIVQVCVCNFKDTKTN